MWAAFGVGKLEWGLLERGQPAEMKGGSQEAQLLVLDPCDLG